MPLADYSAYHQPAGSDADGDKFDNFVDAVQATVNAIDNANIATSAAIDTGKLAQEGAADGDCLVWNMTTSKWVAASTRKMLAAAINGYPGDSSKFLAGDGTWKVPSVASTVITGRVNADGTIAAGSGFSINTPHTTGIYTVTFTASFAATPSIQVTLAADPATVSQRPGISAQSSSSFTVKMGNNSGILGDAAFNFVAYTIS